MSSSARLRVRGPNAAITLATIDMLSAMKASTPWLPTCVNNQPISTLLTAVDRRLKE